MVTTGVKNVFSFIMRAQSTVPWKVYYTVGDEWLGAVDPIEKKFCSSRSLLGMREFTWRGGQERSVTTDHKSESPKCLGISLNHSREKVCSGQAASNVHTHTHTQLKVRKKTLTEW